MSEQELREAIERAMDRLGGPPPSPKPAEPDVAREIGHRVARGPLPEPRNRSAARPSKALSPHLQPRGADQLLPEHRALIGKWATVDLPDGAGVARLKIYTVTVRRDGRVRAEMRPPEGFTVYRTPDELRNVSDSEEG